MTETRRPQTIAPGNGMRRDAALGAVAPPFHLASSCAFEGFERPRAHEYSRTSNPTRDQLADTLAKLEGGAGATVVASGMAAVDLALCRLRPGDRVLAPHDCYSGTFRLLNFRAAMGRFEAIVATDRDGRVTLWNPGATRMSGFNAAEAVDRPLDLIIPGTLRSRHWQGFHKAVPAGRSRYSEGELLSVPAVTKSGDWISIEFTITMLRDDAGAVVGMVAVMRDVTKRFEEQRLLRRKLAELEAVRTTN